MASPLGFLERQGRVKIEWCVADNSKTSIDKLLASDVFILQREFCERSVCPPVISAARALGIPIGFELDDLLIDVPATHPEQARYAKLRPDVLSMLRQADIIIVTTDPLRHFLEAAEPEARDKIRVWPNFINLDIWEGATPPLEAPPNPFVIGWAGTSTHADDLAIISPAIRHLARKYSGKLEFKFWGYLPEDLKDVPGVTFVRGQIGDVTVHARDIVKNRIDLALAPLVDHPFNQAKSDLKWLEYSIGFTPGIYSTVSPYVNSVEHGRTGWLVDNQSGHWVEAIENLMSNNELRRSIAIQAHDEVLRNRTIRTGANRWEAIFRSFYLRNRKLEDSADAKRYQAAEFLKQYAREAAHRRGSWVTRKLRKIRRWTLKTRHRWASGR
ncbi:MAG TPA: hypothetical protein VGY98_02825 [Verrucomicrobiae bacterium]|nr:hypothetical protein [Verrucomicrobiae bacterium]